MTEYETATLAISQAQLGISQAQVWVSAGVGVVQCGLIGWGLWRVGKASDDRNRQLDQQAETLAQVGQTLGRQNEVLAELLCRSA